jgi:D-alanyl-D-alanine carboxypeptidase
MKLADWRWLLVICLVIVIVAPERSSQTPSSPVPPSVHASFRQRLQERLEALHAAGQFPGVTAGFCLGDGSSFGIAAGVSDRKSGKRMTPADLMLQGSVGKTYAAALAMRMVSEGRLDLDSKIDKYLQKKPWFSRLPNSSAITVRMLMNHTSGLVRYEFKEQFTKDLTANPDKVWKPEELIAYILDTTPPFAAGAGWEYSDTNYIVLGMIIEEISGKKYYDLVQRQVLEPLKLTRTVPSVSRKIPGLIQGYAGQGNPFGGTDEMIVDGKFVLNPQFEWTGGGMASTTEDLAKWAKEMFEGGAFPREMLKEMLNGVPARLGPEAKYGLGVIIRPSPYGITYGHSGFFPGYLTEMMYFPEHKSAIAVQVNTSVSRSLGRPLSRFVLELAEIVFRN